MKLKDKLIIDAISALEKSKIVKDGQYESEYKGYISSFGASIVQSGLLPAVIFYENSSRAKSEKKKLINAIMRILKAQEGIYSVLSPNNENQLLSAFIIDNPDSKKEIKRDVNAAAVALKLAIRTFGSKNNPKKQEDEQ